MDDARIRLRDAAGDTWISGFRRGRFYEVERMNSLFEEDNSNAVFSPCRKYRYWLLREWNPKLPRVVFIMLNPSTADEVQNDPTIRRCIGFAKSWGYGSLAVLNIFAFRSTDPKQLYECANPEGADNDDHIHRAMYDAAIAVCAWGTHGAHKNRGLKVMDLIPPNKRRCLKITQDGHPSHPLYLPANLTPMEF